MARGTARFCPAAGNMAIEQHAPKARMMSIDLIDLTGDAGAGAGVLLWTVELVLLPLLTPYALSIAIVVPMGASASNTCT